MKYRDQNAVYDFRPGKGFRVDVDLTETIEVCKELHTKNIGGREMVRVGIFPIEMFDELTRRIIGKDTYFSATVEEQQRVHCELNDPDYKKLRTWYGRIGKR